MSIRDERKKLDEALERERCLQRQLAAGREKLQQTLQRESDVSFALERMRSERDELREQLAAEREKHSKDLAQSIERTLDLEAEKFQFREQLAAAREALKRISAGEQDAFNISDAALKSCEAQSAKQDAKLKE